ncbi:MAG: response regulator transcription factor [Bacteroidales bacterium]|nr:response regulator transcription factor [Bacteroidales bacterium]
MKIAILDDHPAMRKGIMSILTDAIENVEIFELINSKELFELMQSKGIDLLLLDISLKNENGFDVLEKIRSITKTLKVLMVSALSEDFYAYKSIKAGAQGFLSKESASDDLLTAIKVIQKGKKYINPSIALDLIEMGHEDALDKLSERESQILIALGKGESISSIAEKYFLSPKTISTYRTRLLSKLNLKSNADLVLFCLNNNLL